MNYFANSLDTTMTDYRTPTNAAPVDLDQYERETPSWKEDVKRRFKELLSDRYSEDWDGYGAEPVRRDVIGFASEILEGVMWRRTPTPRITPMTHGGVMLEWHEAGIEIEIEIEAPRRVWVYAEAEGQHFEGELTDDFSALNQYVDALPPRPRS